MRTLTSFRLSTCVCVCALITILNLIQAARAQSACPNPPVVAVAMPNVPADVCVPVGFPGNPIQFFDDFSWKSFVALVWPALNGQRGKPDPSKHVGDTTGPLVFETFKADWELFQANPSDWNTFSPDNPCGSGVSSEFGHLTLASFSKFGNFGEAGNKRNLVHALPGQNGTWVRYAMAFNQIEYERIFNDKLYILSNLQKASPLTFPNNSIDIKSSWMDMTNVPHPERYFTRTVTAMNTDGTCSSTLVGLVGLHIVQKTASRPQWIWSTFEHVDNVPPAANNVPTPPTFAFNNGNGGPLPGSDPNGGFPPNDWTKPQIYNVVRGEPIDSTGSGVAGTSTQATNANYQKALGGVWQNYELVMTQWPVAPPGVPPEGPVPATQAGTPDHTFPGTTATSSFSNTTMETWEQKSIATGCMACHNIANLASGTNPITDFVWSLQMNALTPTTVSVAMRAKQSSALRELNSLLESAQ
jgi:hypothetical protein